MKNFFKNWKTTSAGILSIVGGVFLLIESQGSKEVVMAGTSAILAGLGLLFAKDGDVTGVGKDSKTEAEIKREEE